MREIIRIPADCIRPSKKAVLEHQGISSGKKISENTAAIFNRAIELFVEYAHPVGIIAQISRPEFEIIYRGEGLNEKRTPLDGIYKKADDLVLFALTIGKEVSQNISTLFDSNELALASMLDAAASAGTDKVGDYIEDHFRSLIAKKREARSSTGIVRYSPGYCGWHMSGQKKLFEFLHPQEIGITLLDSYIMKPLKSISGIIVVGNREIHNFADDYPFCRECKTHSCRERIRNVLQHNNQGAG